MQLVVSETKQEIGRSAANRGGELIEEALQTNGEATIVAATGASQFEMLDHLVRQNIDWPRITAFHLDEYTGVSMDHPASFRRYLKDRFVDRLPRPIGQFHYIDGQQDPQVECKRLNQLIAPAVVDVAFVGIGENGHLAFNDPPADFDVEEPYIAVDLDAACRRQQLGEGWFANLEEVPRQAISMSIQQIMRSRTIICTVPDERKAEAVQRALEGPVSPDVPASILQNHPDCRVFLDVHAASRLDR